MSECVSVKHEGKVGSVINLTEAIYKSNIETLLKGIREDGVNVAAKTYKDMLTNFHSYMKAGMPEALQFMKQNKGKIAVRTFCSSYAYIVSEEEFQRFLRLWDEDAPLGKWVRKHGLLPLPHVARIKGKTDDGEVSITGLAVALLSRTKE